MVDRWALCRRAAAFVAVVAVVGALAVVPAGAAGPEVSVEQPVGQVDPTATGPVLFDVTFDGAVEGFEPADVSTEGSTAGGPLSVEVAGAGAVYQVVVSGMTSAGTVVVSLREGAANSVADGAPTAASTSADNQVTFEAVGPESEAGPEPEAPEVGPAAVAAAADVPVTAAAVTQEFCSTAPITVADQDSGAPVVASPYPSPITVSGVGEVSSVTATLKGLTHSFTKDLDILLSGPTASTNVVLLSDAGPNLSTQGAVVDLTMTFDDAAAAALGTAPLTSGTFRPYDNDGALPGDEFPDEFPAPAPALSSATALSTFAGATGDGTWNLWAVGDGPFGDGGTIAGGWCVNVTTATPPTVTVNQAAAQADPSTASPVRFDVTFDQAVTGLDGSDFEVSGTAGGTKSVSLSGSGASYTASVSGMTTTGTVVLTLPAGAATGAGGDSGASTSTDNQVTFNATVTREFCNTAPITVPATSGPARGSPYPSPISVGGAGDVISVTATLKDINHPRPAHFDILLSAPTPSKNVVLMSDVGLFGTPASGLTVTLDDNAAASMPAPTPSGTYRPTNVTGGGTESYPGPAPAPSGATTMSTFAGTPGSGTWNLWVVDDTLDTVGSISGGWCLNVTAEATPPTVTVNQAASQADPTVASPVVFDVVFDQPVTGLTGSDFEVTGTAGGTKSVTVTGSGASYTASVAGMTTTGTVVLSLPAAAATGAGGDSVASTSTDNQVTFNETITREFCNTGAIAVSSDAFSRGSIYPSPIAVSGVGDVVAVTATLKGITHSFIRDLDVLLSGPSSSNVVVMSDVGGNNAVSDLTVTLDDNAASPAPDPLVSGSYRPTNITDNGTSDTYLSPAPDPSGATTLGTFAGAPGDGTWNLWVIDDSNGDVGSIAGGWCLNVTVVKPPAPTVTVNQAAGQVDPAEVSPILFDVVFPEPVTGLTGADFVVGGSAGGNKVVTVTGSGTAYTASVAGMTTPGTVTVTLPADRAVSQAGVGNAESTSADNSVDWFPPAPTVTVEQDPTQADPATAGPIVFDVQFSENVTGLSAAGVTTLGSTAGGTLAVSLSGSGASYRAEVSGMTTPGTVVVTVLADAAVSAVDGEGNALSTSIDNEVTWAPPPTVTIEQAVGQTDPAETSPIRFDVVFDQPVTGLTGTDFVVGGTAGGTKLVTRIGSGTTYTVEVDGMTTPGTVTLSLPAGRAASQAGTGNDASTSSDNTVDWLPPAPVVAVEQDATQADPATAGPIVFDVQFSEPVTGLTASDFATIGSTAGGTLTVTVSGSGASYRAEVSGMTTPGTDELALLADSAFSVLDGEGNARSISADNVVTWAPPAPTVTVNQATGQVDPSSAGPIVFTVVFNEAVTGLTGSDFSTKRSTAGGTKTLSVSGSGSNYTVSVSGMTTPGTVVLELPAGAAQSAVSTVDNAASTSTDNSVTYSPPAPTVTVEQAAGQADPAESGPIRFDVVFNETVDGLAAADFSTAGSSAGGTLVLELTGSGDTYTVTVTGMTTPGTVVLSLPAGAALSETTELGNAESTSTDNTVTYAPPAPTVRIEQAPDQPDPASAGPIRFTVVFSEAVTGLDASDFRTTGSTAGGQLVVSVTGGGDTYLASVSGMTSSGTVVLTLPSGAVLSEVTGLGNAASIDVVTDDIVTYTPAAETTTTTTPVPASAGDSGGSAFPAGSSGPRMPSTGATSMPLALLGLVLFGAGVALSFTTRRRRAT